MSPSPPALASGLGRLRRLPLAQLCEALAAHLPFPEHTAAPLRARVFTPWRTFWIFLFQTLSPGQSCRATVQAARLWLGRRGLSGNTAAWCQARSRLPTPLLQSALAGGAKLLCAQVRDAHLWHGRRVRVVDGTSVQLPDTPAHQQVYPQPRTQKPGCGFPVMRLVVMFCLSCGALVAYATDGLAVSERLLWHRLWNTLCAGDVLLGDRGFCSMVEFWMLSQRGVDCVTRLHQRRSTGVRRLKQLGPNDWLVEWIGTVRPQWLTAEQWAGVPASLRVRHVTFQVPIKGFRTTEVTVSTTLLDERRWPATELAELYRRRWQAELYIRNIKTTMGMERLTCKSPRMAAKQLLMYLIAYNLIRSLMWEAAARRRCPPTRLSFKGAVDTLLQWAPLLALSPRSRTKTVLRQFLDALASHRLPDRPDRLEPRALKHRPKNYPLLTKPRRQYQEIPHRNRYKLPLS